MYNTPSFPEKCVKAGIVVIVLKEGRIYIYKHILPSLNNHNYSCFEVFAGKDFVLSIYIMTCYWLKKTIYPSFTTIPALTHFFWKVFLCCLFMLWHVTDNIYIYLSLFCLFSLWCLKPIYFISRKRMRWFKLSLIAKRCQGRT
jgi:hypothetical protein